VKYDVLVAEVTRLLSPFLGESMARAAIQAHGQKLQLKNGQITAEEAETLVGKLGSGLIVFVGRDKAASLATQMRRTLAELARSA
jgi:hypothetical protein